jgi:hypothetical protein
MWSSSSGTADWWTTPRNHFSVCSKAVCRRDLDFKRIPQTNAGYSAQTEMSENPRPRFGDNTRPQNIGLDARFRVSPTVNFDAVIGYPADIGQSISFDTSIGCVSVASMRSTVFDEYRLG